jgi:hypothetical protein
MKEDNPMYELERLAARARAGDSLALGQLKHELEDHMERIVRRAVRSRQGGSQLTERIVAVVGPPPRGDERNRHIGRVARQMCESVLNRLGPAAPPPARDTIYL